MEQADFTLKSGAKLHVSTAPWETVVPLWCAAKTTLERNAGNPKAGAILLATPEVITEIAKTYPSATYDSIQMYPGIFDETKIGQKVRMDQLEIWEKLIEFHLRPFFLMSSSESTASAEKPSEDQRQP